LEAREQTAEERQDAVRRAKNIDISLGQFEEHEHTRGVLLGFPPKPHDVFWDLANTAAQEAAAQSNWRRLKRLHWEMAMLLYGEGRPHLASQRESHKAELRRLAQSDGVTRVGLVTAKCCPACQADNGRTMTVAEALEQMPLPHEGCKLGWCSCMYVGWQPASP
jgi:hypothetical protein